MDIDFIEQKQRDDIFKLMEICGIEMAQAYELYSNSGFSFQTAMQRHFNEGSGQHNTGIGNYGTTKEQYEAEQNEFNNGEDEFQTLYQKYKAYKTRGKNFESNYQIRRQSSFLSSFVPKFLKGASQSNFKKLLQKYFDRPCSIQFAAGSLSPVLAQSQKFPVIAYILDFSPAAKAKVQQILRSNQFSSVVNQQFKNFGIDPSYDIQKTLQKFVDRKKFNNTLIVMRVNAVEEIEILTKIPINNATTIKEAIDKLRLAKNNCISKDLDDVHLQRRLAQEYMGIFDYQKPMSIAQKRKIAQDRQIKKKQQQQFYATMKAQQQKQRKNSIKSQKQIITKPTQNQSSKQQSKIQSPKKVQPKKEAPKRNIPEQRKKLRQTLKTYTEGMNIRLRLPNGQAIVLTVNVNEKGKYLYAYVQSIDKDIGFEKDQDRSFDIIRPYDKLNLSNCLDKTLNQIFQGSDSQNLVVNQI